MLSTENASQRDPGFALARAASAKPGQEAMLGPVWPVQSLAQRRRPAQKSQRKLLKSRLHGPCGTKYTPKTSKARTRHGLNQSVSSPAFDLRPFCRWKLRLIWLCTLHLPLDCPSPYPKASKHIYNTSYGVTRCQFMGVAEIKGDRLRAVQEKKRLPGTIPGNVPGVDL